MLDLTGYRLTFDDEFNRRSISQAAGTTTWGDIRSDWRYGANADIGFGSSSFVDPASGYDPFKVANGALTITAVPDRTSAGYPGSWESGLITTQGGFSQTYGYFEIRADFSSQIGAWDAFWLRPDHAVPDPNHAGGWQELDIVEHYAANDRGVYSTIHTTDPQNGIPWQQNRQVYSAVANASGYHTYGMNWQADYISFYVDGQLVGRQVTPSDMHGPMHLVANLATQTTQSSDNNANWAGVPISSSIDYIRVYSNASSAVAVTLDTVSAPDGRDPGLYGATGAGSATSTSTVTSTPVSTSIGTGSDTLVLKISQDAYRGDALYTVSVDGRQIGGTLTAHASHAAGQSDVITVRGDWTPGDHRVSVNFLNDAYGGTTSTDRNLYVDSATYNDAAVSGSRLALMSNGAQTFVMHDTAVVSATSTSTVTSTPVSTSIGAGSDTLVLRISQDAYRGDALYTISVDGKQIGGTQTAHASHAAGQSDVITVRGDWTPGDHRVSVNFLNDAYGGTTSTDRNLYIDGAIYNDAAVSGSRIALLSNGSQAFTMHDLI